MDYFRWGMTILFVVIMGTLLLLFAAWGGSVIRRRTRRPFRRSGKIHTSKKTSSAKERALSGIPFTSSQSDTIIIPPDQNLPKNIPGTEAESMQSAETKLDNQDNDTQASE